MGQAVELHVGCQHRNLDRRHGRILSERAYDAISKAMGTIVLVGGQIESVFVDVALSRQGAAELYDVLLAPLARIQRQAE